MLHPVTLEEPPTREQAECVLTFIEGWLWGADFNAASDHIRKKMDEILDSMDESELLAQNPSQPGPCVRCGRNPAAGYASYYTRETGEMWFCHGDDDEEQTCYEQGPPPSFPTGWRLDAEVPQVHRDRGIWYVITDKGVRTAWNGEDALKCPVCKGSREAMPTCEECRGRGRVDSVPYCDRPWDEITPGLWLGGIHCQFGNGHPGTDGNCLPGSEFDVVMSLYHDPSYDPDPDVEHHTYRIADADLDVEHHTHLDSLADLVEADVKLGKKVLVRCQAGINRSSLIVALVLIRNGWTADDAIRHMRQKRSPYVLFNKSFVEYIRSVEARLKENP